MIELRVLGALQLSASDGRDVGSLVHQAKRAALLAYLATAVPRGLHRRDKLLALFWPEFDEQRARAALSQAVYVLRATLGEQAITPRADGAIGLSSDVVWCDAAAFETALDAGRQAEALALYRGDLLDGFFLSDAPEFERWLEGERARLKERAAQGAWALAEGRATKGDVFEAGRWARWAAEQAPTDEAVARRLMTFLHRLGDRAAAIRVYEAFAERLAHEYDLEPSAETQALAGSIRGERQRVPVRPPVESAPLPPAALPVAVRRRLSLGWIASSAAVVTALGAGAWAWLRYREPPRALVRFTLEFPDAQPMAGGVAGPTIALSPDGTRLVYLGTGARGPQLFLRPLDRLEAAPVPYTRQARYPFFSTDGEWLGFEVEGRIRKVPLAGGPAITVCTVATDVLGASWGAGNVIVFATGDALWQVPASGGEPQLLALADTARGEVYRWPEVLPDGRAAVFAVQRRGRFHLAAVELETGAVRALGLEGTNPHFVAPGYLVFARLDGAVLAAPFDAGTLGVTGGALPVADAVMVGGAGAAKLGVSHGGALAYVSDLKERALVLVDRAGRADSVPAPPQRFHSGQFSPDGRRIALAVSFAGEQVQDIWIFDFVRQSFTRVTFDGASLAPVWTPDGQRLVLARWAGGWPPGFAVRWMRADGSDSGETLLPAELGQQPRNVAPDGRTLVFQRRHPVTGGDLWILPLDGERRPRPYLRGPADEHAPAVSPDGQWLVYVSNESGREQVYVRAFPSAGPELPVSLEGGREPRWAPSGRELFYRSDQGMVAVAVGPSSPFRVGRRQVLFDDRAYHASVSGAAYDVHPDGRRFLMIRRGREVSQVVVVLNWFAQLRAAAVRGANSP
ncbi:MAG: BTAD domain-containing putative transcriptional regulator [Gemmatimonadales bacterium]